MRAEVLIVVAGWLQLAQVGSLCVAGRVLARSRGGGESDRASAHLRGCGTLEGLVCKVGLGILAASLPAELVGGGRLGMGLCVLLGLLWSGRTIAHFTCLRGAWSRAPQLARTVYDMVGLVFMFLALAYLAGAATALSAGPLR